MFEWSSVLLNLAGLWETIWDMPGANLANSWEFTWDFGWEGTGYMAGRVTGFNVEQNCRILAQVSNYLIDFLIGQSTAIQRLEL